MWLHLTKSFIYEAACLQQQKDKPTQGSGQWWCWWVCWGQSYCVRVMGDSQQHESTRGRRYLAAEPRVTKMAHILIIHLGKFSSIHVTYSHIHKWKLTLIYIRAKYCGLLFNNMTVEVEVAKAQTGSSVSDQMMTWQRHEASHTSKQCWPNTEGLFQDILKSQTNLPSRNKTVGLSTEFCTPVISAVLLGRSGNKTGSRLFWGCLFLVLVLRSNYNFNSRKHL